MRDRILDSVRGQVLCHGFKKFTIDDICTDLKISKKTVYKYFDSKEEMISVIVDSHIEADRANTLKAIEAGGSLYDKLNAAILCYYDYSIPLKLVGELRRFFPQQWDKIEGLFRFKEELFEKIINEGIEQGYISSDVDIDVLMLVIKRTIPAMLDYEFLASHDKSRATANRMLQELCKVIFFGIEKKQ